MAISIVIFFVGFYRCEIFKKEQSSEGYMNGKKLEIPNKFINNFIEYSGQDIWTGEKNEVELSKKIIKNFTIKFSWSVNSSGSLIRSIDKPIADEAEKQKIVTVRIESLNKKLFGKQDRILNAHVHTILSNNNILQPKDIKFSYLGFDQKLSLYKAIPKFENNEYLTLWNEEVYWEYEGNHVVTYIECDSNKISNKFSKKRKCGITFIDDDLMANVSINANRDDLVHWRELKRSTKELIHCFIII